MKYLLFLCLLLMSVNSAFAVPKEMQYPGAVNKLIIDSDKFDEYSKLAKKIGIKPGVKYSYTSYADIQRKHNVGTNGNFDFLLLSTGGNEWDIAASERFSKVPCGWRMTYFKNHNLTTIDEVCRDSDRVHSWVRLLKIAKGKRPKLNLE